MTAAGINPRSGQGRSPPPVVVSPLPVRDLGALDGVPRLDDLDGRIRLLVFQNLDLTVRGLSRTIQVAALWAATGVV